MIAGAVGIGFDAQAVDPPTTPTPGFNLIASDLDFILKQIKIAEAHAAGGQLFGPGPNQVNAPQLPQGLRTVSGELNNSTPGQADFGAADVVFPRETNPLFRPAENFDPDGPSGPAPSSQTSYTQKKGIVVDSQPRVISNLIVDQTGNNPAVVAAAGRNDNAVAVDHDSDPLTAPLFELPNVAPDAGLSAPYNSWFTFFGQFFDHGLDLVNKGRSGIVFMPLQPDDPLYVPGSPTNFMVLSRATNQPGPDGVTGDNPATPADESADDIHEHTNQTSSFVDQNQTYTSHPSHQVFLREYELNGAGKPVSTGKMLEGATGGLSNWAEVKAQAADLLGIQLSDQDALNVPLVAADPYGRFLRGPNGYVQLATSTGLVEGNPAANGGLGVAVPANAFRIGHAFLADIAHHAVPFGDHDNNPGTPAQALTPDADPGTTDDGNPATYDDELLNAHFIAGDGRANENIALTAVHHVFHSEHNRLNGDIKALIDIDPRADFQAEWRLADGSWNGERIFQAAKFVTEMEYQHLVFEEFARKMAPGINVFGEGGFLAHHPDIDPTILAEFAHAAFRLGHSMLPETVARTNADGSDNSAGLIEVFLNPPAFLDGGSAGPLNFDQAAGAIVRGLTRQAGNELDEFVTEAVRNNLLGLPLDLAAINIARGRDTGIPPLNGLRRQIFAKASASPAMEPYSSWVDYGFSLRNPESLVNFVAAYGTHPSVTSASGLAAKRAAAGLLVACDPAVASTPPDCYDFMNSTGAWASGPGGETTTGLDSVDLWVGGLAEKQNPFGGLLGPSLNYIFELQLERLQTGDRLYYLSRLAGTNMLTQLEENSFADLVMRNTDAEHLPLDVFSRPDFTFEIANLGTTGPVTDDPATPDWDESALLVREPNGTLRFNGGEHVLWGGTANPDRVYSSEGDDTIWGDGGNDRLQGGTGNDQIHGGDGDDIITDTFGDDNLKGGLGNDAINAGDGIDLYLGDFGQDYLIGGDDDEQEGFAGPGDDFMYAGDALDEVSGNEGNDWIDGGLADDTLQGDNGDPLELDEIGGHDVIIGNSGSEDLHGEGGNDVLTLDSGGIELVEGMLGFDWGTHKGDTQPANSDMAITPLLLPRDIEDVRDQFKLTEALSGWQFNDILRGDDRLAADMVGHELTSDDIGLINGLAGLLPPGTTTFTNGNIIIGGAGDDLIEGRGGDDLIDGDAWLNVRISVRSASDPTVEIQTVDRVKDLQAAVFAGMINPGQLRIVREILAGAGTDTALFSGPRADYTIVNDGTFVTVSHTGGTGVDGTDRLRNVEFLQFADGTIPVPPPAPPATPTGVTATALNSSTIQVTWNPSAGATSYQVSTNGGAFNTVPGGATATSFTETGLPQNTTRSYRVRAVNGAGNSAPSAPVTATTPSTVVVNPTAFNFGNVGTGSATTTVTVTNNSATPEAITLTKAGTRQADYTIVNNLCVGLVASGASCTYQVTFNPQNLGLLGNLMANLAGRPASVTASVTAPAASAVTNFSGMGS